MNWFVVTVYAELDDNPSAFDVRCIASTLDSAKTVVDDEVLRIHRDHVTWTDGFGGARARHGGLTYDIRPTHQAALVDGWFR